MRKPILRYFVLSLTFVMLSAFAQGEEKKYDVVLESSIRGSAEQPKMIFILPWRSEVQRRLMQKTTIPGHFEHITQPVSKTDIIREFNRSRARDVVK